MTDTDVRDRGERLSPRQLAVVADAEPGLIEELRRAGVLPAQEERHDPRDVLRVRMYAMLRDNGVTAENFRAAIDAGLVGFDDVDAYLPPPSPSSHTLGSLASELGMEPQFLVRSLLVLGLPSRPPDGPIHPDEELILRQGAALAVLMGPEAALRSGRLLGSAIQRVALGQVALYQEQVLRSRVASGSPAHRDRRDAEQTGALTRAMQVAVAALLARHLESASVANWAANVETLMAARGLLAPQATRPSGVAFVDLSGFTRLTEELGDEEGSRLAARLVDEAEQVTALGTGVRIVKLLGDGVMLHGVEASAALDAALTLVESLPRANLPGAHAGVHAGPVIERDGDLFGRTVNLAARIAGAADQGEVLVSSAVVAVVGDQARYGEERVLELKGIARPVSVWRADRPGTAVRRAGERR